MVSAGFSVGHKTFTRGQYCDAQASQDSGNAVGLGVDAQTGLGDPLQTGDRATSVGSVFELNRQSLSWSIGCVTSLIACDIALGFENCCQRFLLFRRRHLNVVLITLVGITDAGQHVSDWVGHRHYESPLTSSPWSRQEFHLHGPSRGDIPDKAQTCGTPIAVDRNGDSGCRREP